jgi:TPR repeat protein
MRSILQHLSVCIFITVLGSMLCTAADFESAKRAFQDKDYAKAFKEVTPLADQGDADAQCLLGKMYWGGHGVLKDPDRAVKLFKLSAAQGNGDAQFFLGSWYLLPHRDVAEGARWLRLSAEQGNQDAQWLLGKAYLEGDRDLPRDPVQAELWLLLAADHNLDFYRAALRAAEGQMAPAQVAKGRALAAAWKAKPGLKPDDEKPETGERR